MARRSVHYYVERGVQSFTLNDPAISAVLVDILKSKNNLKTTRHALKWLQSLSESASVCSRIYQSNGIPVLAKFLTFPVKSVSFYAVQTIHNLLLRHEGSRAAFCKVRGLQKMVTLFLKSGEDVTITVVDCLRILSYKHRENKMAILSSGATAKLVRIIGTSGSTTLLHATSKVLKSLSACSSNKSAIVSAGGVQALEKHLSHPVENILTNCLLTLRNISDVAYKEENVESLLRKLVQLLRNRNKNIISYAAGTLANMTSNNPRNKEIVCKEKGIRALVVALLIAGKKDEIEEPTVHALQKLTWLHPLAEQAQNEVRLHHGLRPIVKLLNPPHTCWPLMKCVIGLVRNLSGCPDNHEPLIELGADRLLSDILLTAYQDISKNRTPPLSHETHPTIAQGVKMEDIVESVLNVLFNLSANDKVMVLLREARMNDTIFEIYKSENEAIKRLAKDVMQRIVFATVLQSQTFVLT